MNTIHLYCPEWLLSKTIDILHLGECYGDRYSAAQVVVRENTFGANHNVKQLSFLSFCIGTTLSSLGITLSCSTNPI